MRNKKILVMFGLIIILLSVNLFNIKSVYAWDPVDITLVDKVSIPTGGYPYGLTWNGTYFCAVLTNGPSEQRGLYLFNRSGVLEEFTQIDIGGWGGIVWDGQYYWITNSSNSFYKIFKYDPISKLKIEEFSLSSLQSICGLAYDGEDLWCVGAQSHKIYKIDLDTYNVTDSFTHPYGNRQSYGIEYINGYLWFSTCGAVGSDVLLIRIKPESHDYDIVYKIADLSGNMWGTTYDGEYIWIVDSGSHYIQAYDGISPEEDNDGDGLSNEEEDIYETNPNKADTDGDGLRDDVEISLNLDPNNWDSDGDGIGDGLEFITEEVLEGESGEEEEEEVPQPEPTIPPDFTGLIIVIVILSIIGIIIGVGIYKYKTSKRKSEELVTN